MKNVCVARVMTPAPAVVERSATVADAERLMRRHACHHLPVVEQGKVVGMLAHVDLLKALVLRPDAAEPDEEVLRRATLSTRHVGDVMQRHVRVLTETATLLDAARALSTGALHALPIVAANGHLVGIVTSTDVMETLADDLQRASGGGASPGIEPRPMSAQDVRDPQVHALLELYRAVRNYLSSGQAEIEHTRLIRAADSARDALRRTGEPPTAAGAR